MTRVSTFGAQNTAIGAMQLLQAKLARTQNQLSTGSKLNRAADDPVAAGVAVALDRAIAENLRFGANANLVNNRLTLGEATLADVGDRVQRLREITIQANGGIYTQQTRQGLLAEVREQYKALLATANIPDGQGRHLFGGSQDASVPFLETPAGVVYAGDQSVRDVDIGAGQSIADVDPGSELFMRVAPGRVAARAVAGNTGTGILMTSTFTDQSQWVPDTYTISFSEPVPGTIEYQVLDGTNTPLVPPVTGPYVAGQSIAFNGYQVSIGGAPLAGDSFTVAPQPPKDIFETTQDLITLLEMPDQPPAVKAAQQNAYYVILNDLQALGDHVTDKRAAMGARLALIESSVDQREAELVSTRTTLSELRDLDYAEAISRLSQETASLQAAQQSYIRMQSLSLFDRL